MPSFYAKPMKDPNDYLRSDQIKAFFSVVEGHRDYVLFQTLLKTGRRVSEVVRSLKPEDINTDMNMINWNILKKKTPIKILKIEHKSVIDMLMIYISSNNIPYDKFVFPISRQRVTQLMQKYGEIAGIPRRRCHVHIWRHTFASMFLASGGRIDALQKRLEHSSVIVTMAYPHYSKKEEEGMLNKMWD